MAVHNFSKLPWGGEERSAFPTGTEPVSLSTFCSSTQLICVKETVVSSGEDLYRFTFSSCSVIVDNVKQSHLMAGLEAEFVRPENAACFQLGNPTGLQKSANQKLGKRKGL